MITVFYANMVFDQYPDWPALRKAINPDQTGYTEVYNGAYVHLSHRERWMDPGWYRMDMTPYPEDQIDPRLKAWLLLLD